MLLILSFISIVLAIFYCGIVINFIWGWIRLPVITPKKVSGKTSVCVIIAARNEEHTISNCLKDVLSQNYPQELIEVIVIDDHSTDRTAAVVEAIQHPFLKLLKLYEEKPINSYKKKAISMAIEATNQELIITTDADCRMGKEWISSIVSFYEQNKLKVISAPVTFHNEQTWFEELQTLEFAYLIGVGAASIGNKTPNTCNGANFAYSREVFMEVGGFKDIDDLASGDDELFLQKVALKYPDRIGFLMARAAIVYTTAKANISEFVSQRRRWASKSVKYKNKWIVMITLTVFFFNISLFVNCLLGYFFPELLQVLMIQFGLKIIVDTLMLWLVCSFLNRKELLKYVLLIQFFYMIYVIIIGIYGNAGKYDWKGRSVK